MRRYLDQIDQAAEADRWAIARNFIFSEPLPFYEELRMHRPVLDLPEVTIVANNTDCTEILRRHQLFSVALYKPKQGEYWMADDDTPNHWREKGLMKAILDREDLPKIRDWVAEDTARRIAEAGCSFDAIPAVTRAVPTGLVQEWFGFDGANPEDLIRWSYWNQMDAFWNQPHDSIVVEDPQKIVDEREKGNAEMREYLGGLVKQKIGAIKGGAKPTDPVSRTLILALSGAVNHFDITRAVFNVGGLLIGTVETTSHAVVNALDYLTSNRDLAERARAAAASDDRAAFDGYVFEALRFHPPFKYFFRVAEDDAIVARGTEFETVVPKGKTTLAITHSAMFDATAYKHPYHFDPTRDGANTFLFGQGLHECLGFAIGGVMIPEMVRQALLTEGLTTGKVDRAGGPVPEAWEWTIG